MKYRLILTKHTKKRMIERDIKVNEIKDTIEQPDYTVKKENKIESFKIIKSKPLKVVYVKKGNFIKIITVIDRR